MKFFCACGSKASPDCKLGRRVDGGCIDKFLPSLFALLLLVTAPGASVEQCPVQPIAGALFLHGGGAFPPPLMEEFLKLCDRPEGKLVVIPSAAEDGKINVLRIIEGWGNRGFAKVQVLHTRSRDEADTEEFIQPLRAACAVWISGGMQSRLEEAYVGTRVERELHALLGRGGVVGGSSAGAAVMSKVMIRSGNPIAEVGQGFGLIGGAVIDQHFVARKREGRLLTVLDEHPGLVGYGIDEGTALVLRGRQIWVVGSSTVTACLAKSDHREEFVEPRRHPWRADHIAMTRAAIVRAANLKFSTVPAVVPKGTVIAFGGGGTTKGGLEHFVDRAGGSLARIVVIYTARADEPRLSQHWRRLWDSVGAKNVRALHARDHDVANSDAFVKEIDAAGGVWFDGGRQWRLVDRYSGTRAEAAIKRVLERGGVVGGSSAGATILGGYLVRGDPMTSRTMMQEGYEQGLGLVPGVAIDQHFSQRNRFKDMLALKRRYPQLLGVGIDEGAAIAFEGGSCEVFGRNSVFIYPVDGERVELKVGEKLKLVE
ncbi:MAG: cyanophycinase [Verrucomicrobiales bacterium]